MMSNYVDQAIALLFPESGRRAVDVKFFFAPGTSEQTLAQQVVACYATLGRKDPPIDSVDGVLTT